VLRVKNLIPFGAHHQKLDHKTLQRSFIFCQAAIKTHSPIKPEREPFSIGSLCNLPAFGLCAPINLRAKVKSFYCQFKERFTVEILLPMAAVVCFVALPIQQCSLRCLGPTEFFRVLIKRSTVDTKEKIKQTNMQTSAALSFLPKLLLQLSRCSHHL
jgi:hypothetical protein